MKRRDLEPGDDPEDSRLFRVLTARSVGGALRALVGRRPAAAPPAAPRRAAFRAVVVVDCETRDQALKVLAERLLHDEDYGFDYSVDWYDLRPEGDPLDERGDGRRPTWEDER